MDSQPTAAMTKSDFEKKFLALVYQTDTVITAPNVAYHLGIPIEEAQDQLIALELNGTIQQATDSKGNTYYLFPNRPAPGTLPATTQGEPRPGGGAAAPGLANPADLPAAPIYSNPGAKGMNINGLVLNLVVPGAGSLVCGKMVGLAMLGLALLGLVLLLLPLGWGRLVGLFPIASAYLWSIVAGIGLLSDKEPGPGVPV